MKETELGKTTVTLPLELLRKLKGRLYSKGQTLSGFYRTKAEEELNKVEED